MSQASSPPRPSGADGIRLLDEGSVDVFPSLLGLYQQRGYEKGYQRAVADLLSSLVWATEQYLRQQQASGADTRKLLYGFEQHLERQIVTLSTEAGYVSGGLGI